MSYKPIKIVNQLFYGQYNKARANDGVIESETEIVDGTTYNHRVLKKTIDKSVIIKSIIIANAKEFDTTVNLYFKNSSTHAKDVDVTSPFLLNFPLLAYETFVIDVTQVLEPGDMIIAETGDIAHKVTIHISGVEVDL